MIGCQYSKLRLVTNQSQIKSIEFNEKENKFEMSNDSLIDMKQIIGLLLFYFLKILNQK